MTSPIAHLRIYLICSVHMLHIAISFFVPLSFGLLALKSYRETTPENMSLPTLLSTMIDKDFQRTEPGLPPKNVSPQ
jgi:hypothetical protein